MKLHQVLANWTKDKVLGVAFIILIASVVIYTSLDINTGVKAEVIGKVIAIGVKASQPYKLPSLIITAQLPDGEVVTVETVKSNVPNMGDKVILVKSERLLSSAPEYEYHGMLP